MLGYLEADGVNDALALCVLQSRLNHLPVSVGFGVRVGAGVGFLELRLGLGFGVGVGVRVMVPVRVGVTDANTSNLNSGLR